MFNLVSIAIVRASKQMCKYGCLCTMAAYTNLLNKNKTTLPKNAYMTLESSISTTIRNIKVVQVLNMGFGSNVGPGSARSGF